jgi:hypothetical protein
MSLVETQRALAQLIRGEAPLGSDPYVQRVAASQSLAVTRKVVLWWRAFGVGRACPLTSVLLRRAGGFEAFIATFVRSVPISPYVEVLGQRFLHFAADCPEPLVAAVARFELAMTAAKRGDDAEDRVAWPCDPNAVLLWLAGPPDDLPLVAASGVYATQVGRSQPRLFSVLRESGQSGAAYALGAIVPPAGRDALLADLPADAGLSRRPARSGSPRGARSA